MTCRILSWPPSRPSSQAARSRRSRLRNITFGLPLPFLGVYAALGEEIETGFRPGPDSFGKGSATTFEIIREGGETSPPVGLAKAREMVMQDKVNTMAGIPKFSRRSE